MFLRTRPSWPRSLFALLHFLALFVVLPAHALEFIQAHKLYLADYVYRESAGDAVKAYADAQCRDNHSISECVGVFTDEAWSSGMMTWQWRGTLTYKHTSGGVFSTPITGTIAYSCAAGWSAYEVATNPGRCSRPEQPEPPCDECDARKAPRVGNPVVVNGGVKVQDEVDYRNASGTLKFVRTYRSDSGTWQHNHLVSGIDYVNVDYQQIPPQACFYGWNGALKKYECFAYAGKGTAYSFGVRRGAGRMIYFGGANGHAAPADINDRVTPVLDGSGARTAWQVSNAANDTVETFSLTGHLQSVTDRNGRSTTYTYSDAATPVNIAPKAGMLLKVQDPFGQSLQFTYDSLGRMASMLDPAGNATAYEYDAKGNISKVTYPDGKFKTYVYNELDKTANIARTNALTGIVDENGNRYATFSYTADPKAASTEHAGAVEKYTLTYPSYAETQVTDPLGAIYKYTYTERLGVLRTLSTRRPGAGGVGTVTASFSYDANANLSLYTDYDGTMTSYTFDLARNLETSRVEASGKAQARTISTEWRTTFRLPLRIAEPLRRTTYTHDAAGNILTKTVQATTDANGAAGFSATLTGTPRTWTYTYSALGQLLTVKSPRTDVNDTTTYTYDEQGNLSTVTNAAGHVTTLSNYDAHGRAGRVTDPNGLVTDFSYTPRGWLSSTTTGSATTSYTHDNAGQLTGVTLPGGATLAYTYDAAHRLTAITDNAGNSIVYTLDAMGNRTSEQVKDSGGTLTRQIARVYDPLNRLKQITGAQQ